MQHRQQRVQVLAPQRAIGAVGQPHLRNLRRAQAKVRVLKRSAPHPRQDLQQEKVRVKAAHRTSSPGRIVAKIALITGLLVLVQPRAVERRTTDGLEADALTHGAPANTCGSSKIGIT